MVKLSDVKSNSTIIVKGIGRGDYKFTLYNMGLYPGSTARVVYSDGISVMVLEVKDSLVVLSLSLADYVDVDVVEGG